MKHFRTGVFWVLLITVLISIKTETSAQQKKIRASLKASITQRLGVDTDIIIDYSRPGVKGRKIWGGLVPYGMAPGNKYSQNNPYPWRGGANENTTIEFNNDLLIEGKTLKAGKYGLHFIPGEENWTVIFSNRSEDWGSYSYDENEDALRVKVKSLEAPHKEWLQYSFQHLEGKAAVLCLHWEKLKVPIKIKIAE